MHRSRVSAAWFQQHLKKENHTQCCFVALFTDEKWLAIHAGDCHPRSHVLHLPETNLAVRKSMRLEGANALCAHSSICMVALSISTALRLYYLHAPGTLQSRILLLLTVFDSPTYLTINKESGQFRCCFSTQIFVFQRLYQTVDITNKSLSGHIPYFSSWCQFENFTPRRYLVGEESGPKFFNSKVSSV